MGLIHTKGRVMRFEEKGGRVVFWGGGGGGGGGLVREMKSSSKYLFVLHVKSTAASLQIAVS